VKKNIKEKNRREKQGMTEKRLRRKTERKNEHQ
jgi:hypothetical protein